MKECIKNISYINHDINNHLAIATGYFELLLKNSPDLKDSPYTTHILNGLLRASELSKDISNACKDIKEEKNTEDQDFVIIPVQEHLKNNVTPAISKLMKIYDINIDVKFSLIEENKSVYLNPVSLVRARENIVSNALAAGATQLDISYEMGASSLIVIFKDNGKGMTQNELDKIMLSQQGDGTHHGIGTKSILDFSKTHGFFISYSSDLGKGTTIRALVPYFEPLHI